jgi:HEPN domain-containing protein
MIDRVKYWTEVSDYDIETAEAMLKAERYLYVAFMCHQSVEKILKAVYSSINENQPPFSHGLVLLAKKAGIYDEMTDEYKDFLDILQPLNIEARYPSDKDEILRSLTKEKCRDILNKTREIRQWIKMKL